MSEDIQEKINTISKEGDIVAFIAPDGKLKVGIPTPEDIEANNDFHCFSASYLVDVINELEPKRSTNVEEFMKFMQDREYKLTEAFCVNHSQLFELNVVFNEFKRIFDV